MTKKKTTTPEIAILLLDRSSEEGSRSVSKGTNIIWKHLTFIWHWYNFYLKKDVHRENVNIFRVTVCCNLLKVEAGYFKFVNCFLSSLTLA